MSWLRRLVHKPEHSINPGSSSSDPPEWSAAPEPIHALGLYNEATDDSYESAEQFCDEHPQDPPKLLPSRIVDAITERGCAVWGFEVPEMFSRRERGRVKWRGGIENVGEVKGKSQGVVRMWSEEGCRDVCLLSDVPILGGLYDTRGKQGVYFEVLIKKMEGVIAIGTACRPYPAWRLPGWNRSSVGLHLDDLRKFFEDPDGGRDYLSPLLPSHISPGDTIG
ncbi:hypothetical protein JAAARDRAFT_471518 [Jaapia argillacea MUCL 33604]|uniref:Uncharacterized protein n=1 Tax=Jaapia argillacea MUCL 33604 TaxID=933084 RepID=A0A067Q6Y0_9AGAM|nr:hypothetical protein JAAARDRAFT_471518 [Jaapia argillacea MUCL 33604]